MDHFNVTVEKDGTQTTTRRGLRVSKQKHKGTSFVHSSAPQDDLPPSPPPKKKSSSRSSKTEPKEKQFRFVTKDEDEPRASSSRRSKTQSREDEDDDEEEEDGRRSSHRRQKKKTSSTPMPPQMSYSSTGMGQGELVFAPSTDMSGTAGYPQQQQPTFEDFSYYPGTTGEMTYPITAAWPDMSAVGVGAGAGAGQEQLYPGYFDLAPQEGYPENPPQFPDMYYYDASGHQRYGGQGGQGGGYP